VVDLAAWKERFAVQLPGAVFFPVWSADDARIYVPTQQVDGIHIVDGKTGALRGGRAFSAAECVLPHEVQLAPGGASLLVVCEGDHKSPGSIIAIDATTLAFQGTLSVGTYPDRLALAEAP
jgi:hypothetical protein